ncbi:MAG: polysaccharide biosynthesis C-terminal domain-containing protein, partial [Patescibacteria group bacterium]
LGYKVFENILPIPIFFVNALYPVMLSDYRRGLSFLVDRMKKSIRLLVGAAVGLAGVGFVLAPWVIEILGGADFSASTAVIRILVLSLPLFFVTAPLQWFLITVGKEKVLPAIYASAAVLNVSINWIFIPRYSYFASITATVAAELVILVLLSWQTLKERTR